MNSREELNAILVLEESSENGTTWGRTILYQGMRSDWRSVEPVLPKGRSIPVAKTL